MGETWTLLLQGWAALAAVMLALWLLQRRTGDAGVVDVAWAAGLGALGVFYAVAADGAVGRRVVLALLAGAWGFRLGGYLLVNRVLQGEEDGRYQQLKLEWGAKAQPRLFWFFQAQALLAVILSAPFLIVATRGPAFPSAFDVAAVALWVVALTGESLADRQLARFRADSGNRGKTCRAGLWRYSRHPNYFFEWLHWWSYVLLALPQPVAWVGALSPLLLLFLILKVTGIPPTEEQALRSRGDDYRDYQRTTSPFVPWFPRTSS